MRSPNVSRLTICWLPLALAAGAGCATEPASSGALFGDRPVPPSTTESDSGRADAASDAGEPDADEPDTSTPPKDAGPD